MTGTEGKKGVAGQKKKKKKKNMDDSSVADLDLIM
jgi:hypothetical protein